MKMIESSIKSPTSELTIAYFDCDCFFAAVEKRDHPSLNSKPIVVAGNGPRTVVAAACYLARLYGIKSAMPVIHAKKLCPKLTLIPHNFTKYYMARKQIKEILLTEKLPLYFDRMDEGYLDLRHYSGDKMTLCRHLQNQIRRQLKLTISFGLGVNPVMAKIICNIDKPNGLTAMGKTEIRYFLADKPVGLLPGVGFATQKHLQKIGITRISQLQGEDPLKLIAHLGKFGATLKQMSLAEARPQRISQRLNKIISIERTFNRDLPISEKLYQLVDEMSFNLETRLKQHHQSCYTISLKLRHSNFTTLNRNITINEPFRDAKNIRVAAHHLLKQASHNQHNYYRLIGLTASGLSQNKGTLPLFCL